MWPPSWRKAELADLIPAISLGRRRFFQRRVLAWYAENARDLPWRKTRDPYAILVSEILSHQTQIARVVPVYRQLLRRYPTAGSMARARLASVKRITDPLGYKVRGRWLHGAALQIADRGVPNTVEGLRSLPGVGRYTAGAVLNFAYRQDRPVVDTNIARILGRYFGSTDPGKHPEHVWRLAAELVPAGEGHRYHQGLMDIGALICRARSPRCADCPLQRSCCFRRDLRQGHPPLPER